MAGGVVSAAGLSQAVRVGATTRAPRRQITRAVAGPAAAGGVWVTVEKHVEWGQSVGVVGPRGWERGSPLHWHEGDVWEGEVAEGAEFKLAVLDDEGRVLAWERGPNRSLTPAEEGKPLRLQADFDVDEPSDANGPSEVGVDVAANASAELAPPAAPVGDGELPGWAAAAVWYQIYPLGFCDCPPTNDHRGDPVPRLRAVTGYVDHLQALGVGCVLFNPLCESDTHGYDTTDYKEVDRRLGTVEDMRALVEGLHAKGIRVVLDGVFNHTGRSHPAFQQCVAQGLASPTASWYHLKPGTSPDGDGFEYESWEGHANLPRLNLAEPAVRAMIFDAARFWLQDVGVDGWRLDVAHEIAPEFWREFAAACRAAKPDCVLVGELIHGNYRERVGPGLLHSATNYQLSKALWSSLNDENYYELAHCLQRSQAEYGGLTLLEFVGNHDMTRLADRLRCAEHFELAQAALLLGVGGMPCLYYGDEFGMEGRSTKDGGAGCDADVRRVPPAPEALDAEQRRRASVVSQMLALRAAHPALCRGSTTVAAVANQQLAVARSAGSETALVLFNCTDEAVDDVPPHAQLTQVCPAGTAFTRLLSVSRGQMQSGSPGLEALEGGRLRVEGGLAPRSVSVYLADRS